MSAGEFNSSKYESSTDVGGIYKVRVQPETEAAQINSVTNTPVAAAVNRAVSAKVGKTIREIGMGTQMYTLKFTAALPDGYKGDNVRIPGLSIAFRNAATLGQTGTYLSVPVEVVGISPERVK